MYAISIKMNSQREAYKKIIDSEHLKQTKQKKVLYKGYTESLDICV